MKRWSSFKSWSAISIIFFRRSQKRKRKPPSQPMVFKFLPANFIGTQSGDINCFNSPGQRFGGLTKKMRRRTSQDKETSRKWFSVRKNSEQRENVRKPLNFIDDNQTFQSIQNIHRILSQNRQACRVFKVKIVGGPGTQEHSSQRCFSTLTWPNQGGDATAFKGFFNLREDVRPFDHGSSIDHEIPSCKDGIPWLASRPEKRW